MSDIPETVWLDRFDLNDPDGDVGETEYIRKDKYDAAIDRLKDMLQGDDGQAWKEAEKFMAGLGK
ncbi:MAG: hypothetical protein JKY93_12300 [Gammaproteobacteria bacterium]|nr:hypothetical protein [Gammaproteobacteria bacterium]